MRICFALALLLACPVITNAQTPAEAYAKGCGGCHTSERAVMRDIPRLPDAERRVWIATFMAGHPCEADSLKPLISDYLMQKTRR